MEKQTAKKPENNPKSQKRQETNNKPAFGILCRKEKV